MEAAAILDLSTSAQSPGSGPSSGSSPSQRESLHLSPTPNQSAHPLQNMQKLTFEVAKAEYIRKTTAKTPKNNENYRTDGSSREIKGNGQTSQSTLLSTEEENVPDSTEEVDVGSPPEDPVDLTLTQTQTESEATSKHSHPISSNVSGSGGSGQGLGVMGAGGVLPGSGAGAGATSGASDSLLIPFLMAAASSQRAVLAAALASAASNPGSSKKFKCEKCNAAFSSSTTLDAHSKSYCPGNPDKSPARQLNGSSSNAHKLIPKSRESNIHSAVITALSKAQSPNSSQVPTSLPSESGTVLIKKHECDACGIRFMHLDTLKTHQEVYCKIKRERSSSLSPNDNDVTSATQIKEENITHLPLSGNRISRKRRSPSLDQDTSLKPFAKYPCNNCPIKFNCENNLIAHQKFYCLSKGEHSRSTDSYKRETLTSPNESSNLNVTTEDSESPNLEGENVSSGQDNILCKLCDGPVVKMFLRHHLYAFHRIVHKDLISDLINKYCSSAYQDQAPSTPPPVVKSEAFAASREVTGGNPSSRSVSPLSQNGQTNQADDS